MARSLIVITHGSTESQADIENRLEAVDSKDALSKLAAYLESLVAGFKDGVVEVAAGDAVRASGTFTFDTLAADDTIVINGVTLTAKESPAGESQFGLGADDDEAAENAAAKINAHSSALLSGLVTASAASGVVTVTVKQPGKMGNCVTLSATGGATASGARATGGAGTLVTHARGQVAD